MERRTYYTTVSEAIDQLQKKGFRIDFNYERYRILNAPLQSFHIVDVYRYEGETDPADEAAVYALESDTGARGILVTGYGGSDSAADLLSRLDYPAHK